MSKAKEAFPKARRGEDRKGPRQTGPKTKRDVSGVVVGVPANGWNPAEEPMPPDRKKTKRGRQKKDANPKNRFRPANGVLQAVRRGPDGDSRPVPHNRWPLKTAGRLFHTPAFRIYTALFGVRPVVRNASHPGARWPRAQSVC